MAEHLSRVPASIVHASLESRDCPRLASKPYPASAATQKLMLLILAAHEDELVSVSHLAALAGVSVEAAGCTLAVLIDRGLVQRVGVGRDHPTSFPVSPRGPTFAYRLAWSAIVRLPKVVLTTKVKQRTTRRTRKAVPA